MPQNKKKRTDKDLTTKTPSKSVSNTSRGRWTGFIIASVFVVFILIVVGFFYYYESVAPFQRAIITVDDTSIKMSYFLKRLKMAESNDPMSMLTALTYQQLIKIEAPKYVSVPTEEDITWELMRQASGAGDNTTANISESEFKEWYRQQRNESGLTDAEYKDLVRTSLLADRFQQYLAERVPPVAEQVHLHAILLGTYEEALQVKARLESGESFAALAKEVSLDGTASENGGDLGWVPRGVMNYNIEYTAFNLTVDNVSDPVLYDPNAGENTGSETQTNYYLLLMVSEKDPAHELTGTNYEIVKSRALNDWLLKETSYHQISYTYNSEIDAWIKWQLSKT